MSIRVPVLLYHSIAEEAVPRFRRWVVRPRLFAVHMAYLHDRGYTPITVTQFAQTIVDRGAHLPERPVVITFDDGLADFYTHALPVLTDHGFAATLYVAAGFIGGASRWLSPVGEGTRPMLTWEQLAEVAAAGVECGAHTLSHPQLDILSPAAARHEVTRSRWLLEQRLGRQVATFAYPHGYYSATVRRFVREAGYSSACAVKHAMSATSDDRFALARLIVTDTAATDEQNIEDFARLLTGRGLRAAPLRERVRTKGWRVVRRSIAVLERHQRRQTPDTGAGAPREGAADGEMRPATGQQAPPLLVHNLLNTLEALARLLPGEMRRGSWLNAYLLAAGMNQIVEDYLHPDPYSLGKAATYLARLSPPLGPAAARTARAIAEGLAGMRDLGPTNRRLARRQAELAALVQQLAEAAICPTLGRGEESTARAEALLAALGAGPPRLLHEVIRLPSCFRSFDQQPDDLARMVREFARRWPDRRRPLVVVGIRASGSYLAPLYAALLKVHGYERVRTLTIRPGRRLLTAERALLRAANRRGALVLLTDDPPSSGETIAEAARDLERAGVRAEALILLLQLFGGWTTLPPSLRGYTSVLLPWEEWAIHEQMAPRAIQSTLARMVAPADEVCGVERLPLPSPAGRRGHAQGLYRAHLLDRSSGQRREQHILAQGAGLGYFGEHTLAIWQALRPYLPRVYGVQGGLLYRDWVPEEREIRATEPGASDAHAAAMVDYILARHRALAVEEDVSMRLIGRLPVWEVASNLVSRAFGRGWLLVRVPVLDPIVRRMLRCRHPSVIDGSMTPAHCFIGDGDGARLIKVDFAERAFTHRNLACYDPVFDLAGLAASLDLPSTGEPGTALPRQVRATYEERSGEAIGEERWLLYQLVHLWARQHLHGGDRTELRRARARALQRYFAAILFKGVTMLTAGALCALDIDGVLETEVLGFPGMTLAAALALRALTLHGYRPVLATGRSLDEVRERCAAYRLAGGVAEYGAVAYDHGTGRVRQLLSGGERRDLARLRETLGTMAGVCLDPDYHHAVRAFHLDAAGHRRGLGAEVISAALAASGTERRIRAIAGEAQTDFMAIRIDKGVGLRALAEDLGGSTPGRGREPVALAVGDTVSDLPMFALASLRFAPRNADRAVRAAGVPVLTRSYQRGLALAVGRLLGHTPGSCPICRAPRLSPDARLFLLILGAREAGTWGMARRALLLAARARWAMLRGRWREEED